MSEKGTDEIEFDPRPAYEPPRALRLSDARTGSGGALPCNAPGSGDLNDCLPGVGAIFCLSEGSSAAVKP